MRVSFLITNQLDWSWPLVQQLEREDERVALQTLLRDTTLPLNKLYVLNPCVVDNRIAPVPIGLKWQSSTTRLYGEPKSDKIALYRTV